MLRKLRNNQIGFGAVEALLLIVIIGTIGFTGWFVMHTKQSTDKTLAPNNSTTPTIKKQAATKSTSTSTSTNDLSVKEWGIQIPTPSSGDSYSYSMQDSENIWVTNQQLTKALADAAKVSGQDCGISGIQVLRTTQNNVSKTDPRKYTPVINGYVYGLTQGPIAEAALFPCNGNKDLADAITLAESQLASVWDKVTALSN